MILIVRSGNDNHAVVARVDFQSKQITHVAEQPRGRSEYVGPASGSYVSYKESKLGEVWIPMVYKELPGVLSPSQPSSLLRSLARQGVFQCLDYALCAGGDEPLLEEGRALLTAAVSYFVAADWSNRNFPKLKTPGWELFPGGINFPDYKEQGPSPWGP